MLVNGTHVRRLDLDGKAAAEPPFAAEMRDHTFLQPHTTPQNVGGPHLFEGQSASGTADDPVIIENMDGDASPATTRPSSPPRPPRRWAPS